MINKSAGIWQHIKSSYSPKEYRRLLNELKLNAKSMELAQPENQSLINKFLLKVSPQKRKALAERQAQIAKERRRVYGKLIGRGATAAAPILGAGLVVKGLTSKSKSKPYNRPLTYDVDYNNY